MDDSLRKFEERHRAVTNRHRQLARGYVTKLGKNGLIEHHPRKSLPKMSFPTFTVLLVGFLAFKAFLLASLGDAEFSARVDALANGTVFERAGAWVMQIDPLSQWIVAHLLPLLT